MSQQSKPTSFLVLLVVLAVTLLLASSLLIGQCICGVASVMLVTALERVGAGKMFAFEGGKR